MKKFLTDLKKRINSGSSLVTVIIIVAFMSILGTIALYISGTNYKMKVIDSNNKQSFYDAETVVEIFKSALVSDVATASQRATKAAGASYIEDDSVAIREDLYLKNFKSEFKSLWDAHWNNSNDIDGSDPINEAQAVSQLFGGAINGSTGSYVIENGDYTTNTWSFDIIFNKGEENEETLHCVINDLSSDKFKYKESLSVPTNLLTQSSVDNTKNTPSSYEIKDFNITVSNELGNTSVIHTSFKITPPSLNWDSSSVLTGENISDISESDYTDCVVYLNWSKE